MGDVRRKQAGPDPLEQHADLAGSRDALRAELLARGVEVASGDRFTVRAVNATGNNGENIVQFPARPPSLVLDFKLRTRIVDGVLTGG